jgi:hypothetical protein
VQIAAVAVNRVLPLRNYRLITKKGDCLDVCVSKDTSGPFGATTISLVADFRTAPKTGLDAFTDRTQEQSLTTLTTRTYTQIATAVGFFFSQIQNVRTLS